jgi:hypothetical protein
MLQIDTQWVRSRAQSFSMIAFFLVILNFCRILGLYVHPPKGRIAMTFITHEDRSHDRRSDYGIISLGEIAVRCGAFLLIIASLPVLLLTLPFVLLSGGNLKDGEYWD